MILISKSLREISGVIDAVAILATKENREILAATDMLVDDVKDAGETDIVIVVKADTQAIAEKAIAQATALVKNPPGMIDVKGDHVRITSIQSAVKSMGSADLCLISIAGKYAAAEANKALDQGLHVMMFSDNVSLEDELALKKKAVAKKLLMMGPDCGTAIINGIPLAFANAVPKGKIGIVSASGTGLQEVSVGIANRNCGISQAFGTGGRDGKKEIGGLMLLSCFEFLVKDPLTKVIVVIGKPPDEPVLIKFWARIAANNKPVIVNFMVPLDPPKLGNLQYSTSLDEAAMLACKASGVVVPEAMPVENLPFIFEPGRKYIRGLYSGGSLCQEAIQLYKETFGTYPYSNIAMDEEFGLHDVWKSWEDTFIDMGSDEFTVGRPHPMIDFSLRLKKMAEEAQDPEVAIIIIDVVLGYGAHPDPAAELVPVLNSLSKNVRVICHVLGTKLDPQNAELQRERIAETGARVFGAHHKAVEFALQQLLKCRR